MICYIIRERDRGVYRYIDINIYIYLSGRWRLAPCRTKYNAKLSYLLEMRVCKGVVPLSLWAFKSAPRSIRNSIVCLALEYQPARMIMSIIGIIIIYYQNRNREYD